MVTGVLHLYPSLNSNFLLPPSLFFVIYSRIKPLNSREFGKITNYLVSDIVSKNG